MKPVVSGNSNTPRQIFRFELHFGKLCLVGEHRNQKRLLPAGSESEATGVAFVSNFRPQLVPHRLNYIEVTAIDLLWAASAKRQYIGSAGVDLHAFVHLKCSAGPLGLTPDPYARRSPASVRRRVRNKGFGR